MEYIIEHIMEYITIIAIIAIIAILVYRNIYFKSKKFKNIKDSVSSLTNEFNDLNIYADTLSVNILGGQTRQTFVGETINNSRWAYKHSGSFSRQNHSNVYNCSRSVVSNAQLDGFKYLCKYFNITVDEEHRNLANEMLNNFITYTESRKILEIKRDRLYTSIKNKIPFLIKIFKESLYKKLDLVDLDLKSVIYPRYTFAYTSSGGNSGLNYTLELSTTTLNQFIEWLDKTIKYKKSAQYQRIIMTSNLRNRIKERDNFSCKKCGISINDEPTLLLEIDHIIPISKGGMSVDENLQCLCWKCNRSKGSKIYEEKETEKEKVEK